MNYNIGDTKENSFGRYTIISKSADTLEVRFERTGTVASFHRKTFKNNQCLDYMQPTNLGGGYLGEPIVNNCCPIKHKASSIWKSMLRRCYDPLILKDRPNYEGCSVAKEWLNFSTFRLWFEQQVALGYYKQGYQLDKDLLNLGNKEYSAENCVFLPSVLNSLLQVDKRSVGNYLPGVSYEKSRGKFKSEVNYNGVRYYLPRVDSETEAFENYKALKEELVRGGVGDWPDIDPRATEAFKNYSIDWVYSLEKYGSC